MVIFLVVRVRHIATNALALDPVARGVPWLMPVVKGIQSFTKGAIAVAVFVVTPWRIRVHMGAQCIGEDHGADANDSSVLGRSKIEHWIVSQMAELFIGQI